MYKLLIVDDEFIIRRGIEKFVSKECTDYIVVNTFENGKDAISYLNENKVDVVLTDINMPFVDGIELSKYIHTNAPETKIIIISGYREFEYAQKAIEFDVYRYLLKPIEKPLLKQCLKELAEILECKQNIKEKQEDEYLPNETEGELSPIIQKAKEYMVANYKKDISLEEVANFVFLNPSYFSRLFKQQTGENFLDYLIKIRMNEAISLLKQHYKSHLVYSKVGYNDSRYFNKMFKKYTGYSLKDYVREVLREKDNNL